MTKKCNTNNPLVRMRDKSRGKYEVVTSKKKKKEKNETAIRWRKKQQPTIRRRKI